MMPGLDAEGRVIGVEVLDVPRRTQQTEGATYHAA